MITQLRDKYKDRLDERFFKELFEEDEYKAVLYRPLTTVIDVGALAGEFGAYIYEKAGTIYALEPHEPHFQELTENIAEFHLDKIKPYRLALSGHNGTAKLTRHEARGGNHLEDIEGAVEVPTKTLAQFMQDEGIEHVDVLKIDIEGGEDKVFNAPDFITVSGKIDLVIGEHLSGVRNILIEEGFKVRQDEHNTIFYREDE